MPPVSKMVDASRLVELNDIITARASPWRRGTFAMSSASSYTCTRMPVRVVAEGRISVSSGIAASSCKYSDNALPRERCRKNSATRSAKPLRCTARPIVSTPIRKYATGSEKPDSASRKPGTPPDSTSPAMRIKPVTAAGSASEHHSTIANSAMAITRLPGSGKPAGVGAAISAAHSTTAPAANHTARFAFGAAASTVVGLSVDTMHFAGYL